MVEIWPNWWDWVANILIFVEVLWIKKFACENKTVKQEIEITVFSVYLNLIFRSLNLKPKTIKLKKLVFRKILLGFFNVLTENSLGLRCEQANTLVKIQPKFDHHHVHIIIFIVNIIRAHEYLQFKV